MAYVMLVLLSNIYHRGIGHACHHHQFIIIIIIIIEHIIVITHLRHSKTDDFYHDVASVRKVDNDEQLLHE